MQDALNKVAAENRKRMISGVALGLILTILIWLAETYGHFGGITFDNLLASQQNAPVCWMADLFPIIIAVYLWFGSRKLLYSHQVMLEAEKKAAKASEQFSQMTQLREAAEKSNKAKSDFLAHMSHEIRTPMNAILGMNYLMKKTSMDNQQVIYNQKIDAAAKDLLRIIDDILDFSKIEAGKLTMESVRFDIHELVFEVSDIVQVKLAAKPEIRYSVKLDAQLPSFIISDPVRLKQVLINLLDNAIKFTNKGSVQLEIRVASNLSYGTILEFSVTDTGIGMNATELQTVFAPFSQADFSITRKYGGTGLGLAISQRIVEMMDGELRAESEVGKGSRFHFAAFFSISELAPAKKRQSSSESKRCLLATNRADDLEWIPEYLGELGFQVETVNEISAVVPQFKDRINQEGYYSALLADEDFFMRFIGEMAQTGSQAIDKRQAPIILLRNEGSPYSDIVSQMRNAYEIFRPVSRHSLEEEIQKISSLDKKISHPTTISSDAENYKELFTAKKVLLVEDNEVNMVFASEILRSAGFEILHAVDGAEALHTLEKNKIDLVLMDIQMPVMDGLEATRRIREQYSKTELPVIAMTAHAMREEYERSLQAGMNDHVTKPIDPQHLYRTIASNLSVVIQ